MKKHGPCGMPNTCIPPANSFVCSPRGAVLRTVLLSIVIIIIIIEHGSTEHQSNCSGAKGLSSRFTQSRPAIASIDYPSLAVLSIEGKSYRLDQTMGCYYYQDMPLDAVCKMRVTDNTDNNTYTLYSQE